MLIAWIILLVTMAIVAYIDYKSETISMFILVIGGAASVLYQIATLTFYPIPAIIGSFVAGAIFLLLALFFCGGGGDVLMMVVLGFALGVRYISYAAILSAPIYLLILFLKAKKEGQPITEIQAPFAPSVFLSMLLLFFPINFHIL